MPSVRGHLLPHFAKSALHLFTVFSCLSLVGPAVAQQRTAQATAYGKSVQLLPSSPLFVAGLGDVTTYFSTFNGTGSIPLIDSSHGSIVSGELRPRTNAAGVYEGSYGQATILAYWDYGSYALSIPVTDTDANGVPDCIQFDRPGTFSATGSGYSGSAGLTFSISIAFTRAANSANGTYKATTQNSAGEVNSVSGPYVLLSYRGTVSYVRGASNTFALSLSGLFTGGTTITGTTTFTTSNADTLTMAAFTAKDLEGRQYQVKAATLARTGNRYQGNLSLTDGLPDTYWPDFTAYSIALVDTNDTNGDGTPDLTDPTMVLPAITSQPQNQTVSAGGNTSLSLATSAGPDSTFQWMRNGNNIPGATASTLPINAIQPTDSGIYTASVRSGSALLTSSIAIVGLSTTKKVYGDGSELGSNIYVASNGNTFDQVLLSGSGAAITSDYAEKQITRISFIDLDDDIVQVEFSGPGTLSLALDNSTGPALPVNYNQSVIYMKGHAGIVITGANENTNVSVFSVGKATAVNQALFKDVKFDGIADIAYIAITSTNGKFGGIRTANANYFARKGVTGVYAPGITFYGPVFIGNITAFESAKPMIFLGSVTDARITGGDLFQDNGEKVEISGITRLSFAAGTDSHGNLIAAKANRAVLWQNGVDVTAAVVVNP